MTLKMPDLYWVAGFLEGEGSFTYTSSLALSVHQVQREPLERLQSLFGGAIYQEKRSTPRAQPCHGWYRHGYRAAALMMTLYPIMSPKRQDQIRRALARWKAVPVAHQHRPVCAKGHPYTRTSRNPNHRECRICLNENARLRYNRGRKTK